MHQCGKKVVHPKLRALGFSVVLLLISFVNLVNFFPFQALRCKMKVKDKVIIRISQIIILFIIYDKYI
jgi:hypothetical protein